jgi:hypothetical protein
LVHLVGFITKKFVMMHGHMNVKEIKQRSLLLWRNLSSRKVAVINNAI